MRRATVNGIEPLESGDAAFFSELAAKEAAEAPKKAIKQQIVDLEASITKRREREAILGIDNGWLANVDTQIAALRAQL